MWKNLVTIRAIIAEIQRQIDFDASLTASDAQSLQNQIGDLFILLQKECPHPLIFETDAKPIKNRLCAFCLLSGVQNLPYNSVRKIPRLKVRASIFEYYQARLRPLKDLLPYIKTLSPL